eukprot:31114-Pelagococcus_subviridis.AAC.4
MRVGPREAATSGVELKGVRSAFTTRTGSCGDQCDDRTRLVLHLHLLKDRRAVVRDRDLAVAALEDLVHALRRSSWGEGARVTWSDSRSVASRRDARGGI